MTIMKNGRPIARWNRIHQCFYCPAISLYNYARVEIRLKDEQIEYMPEGYKPYRELYSENIQY